MRTFSVRKIPTSAETVEALGRVQPHIAIMRRDGEPIHQAYFDALWTLYWQLDPAIDPVIDDLMTCLEYRLRNSKVGMYARPLIYTPPNRN